MTTPADRVFWRGFPRRSIPQTLLKDRDTADFIQELLLWRSHLKRTGEPYLWPSTVGVPDDSVPADGSAISRTKYAALFSVYGEDVGAGDGSTTFNVPNLTGITGTVVLIQV